MGGGLTELHDDFTEIIRMSGPYEKSNVAYFSLVRWIASK